MTERISGALERIRQIPGETTVPEPFRRYFSDVASFLLSVRKDAGNRSLYEDILPGHYARSFANPDFAAETLGEDFGPLLSAVYAELRGLIPAVFEDDEEGQAILLELFLLLYFEFENEELPKVSVVRNIFGAYLRDYTYFFTEKRIRAQVGAEETFFGRMVMEADLEDPSYLERFGEYISDDIRRTAAFMNALPEETVRLMASTYTEGFRRGFELAGKNLSNKRTVQIVFQLGFERMIRQAAENFREMGLEPVFLRYSPSLVTKAPDRRAGCIGAVPNMQFDYDHREDLALVLDDEFVSARKRAFRDAFESVKEQAAAHAGPAVVETFGEEPFVPEMHRCAIRMTREESERYIAIRNDLMTIRQRYIPEKERSFTIIAFPVPAIGEHFPEIFRETILVNTLDSGRYQRIQQKLIDELDRGCAVRVLGRNGNETDLTVALQRPEDPTRQTVFENCTADVNIPVGEVFTSPVLRGTGGLLHVKRVFLNGFEFLDLRIRLADGMIASYSCGNFDSEEENRSYIEENILYHHPTLPLGEFAIGTNTTAYVMARRYGIEALLPILIAEKTGPHFAMGDTCYSMEEDNPVFNPDGKEIIARDNEHTLIRKSDPSRAYYGCHTDITIPYDELGSIEVLTPDGGRIALLSEGRFVLPGTEELNGPLDDYERESAG